MSYSSLLRSILGAVCVLFVAISGYTTGQTNIKVGMQPLAIIPVGSNVHVFCNGLDNNFNSIYEPDNGDVAASWWVIDTQTRLVLKHREFTDRYLPFPFRIALSKETEGYAYIGNGNRISSFLISTLGLDKDTLAILSDFQGTVYASSYSEGSVFLSCRQSIDILSSIVGIGAKDGKRTSNIIALINPQQTIEFRNSINKSILLVLNEGSFGSNNSNLQVFDDYMTLISTNIPLGDGGNHIFYEGKGHDSVFVTVNGSHKVVIVDLNKKQIVKSIPTFTTGYNGPRESAVIGNKLFVTTYNSDVREFDIETGSLIATLNSKGKPEGLTVINGKLWVANAFGSGSYLSDSTIAIFETPLAVEEYFTENKNIVYPNPASNSTTISTSFSWHANAPVAIELYSISGTKLLSASTTSGSSGEVNYVLPLQDISTGSYYVRVTSGTMVQVTRLMRVAQ